MDAVGDGEADGSPIDSLLLEVLDEELVDSLLVEVVSVDEGLVDPLLVDEELVDGAATEPELVDNICWATGNDTSVVVVLFEREQKSTNE
jgi:hypothetical protein